MGHMALYPIDGKAERFGSGGENQQGCDESCVVEIGFLTLSALAILTMRLHAKRELGSSMPWILYRSYQISGK